jgi:hypothetical protein
MCIQRIRGQPSAQYTYRRVGTRITPPPLTRLAVPRISPAHPSPCATFISHLRVRSLTLCYICVTSHVPQFTAPVPQFTAPVTQFTPSVTQFTPPVTQFTPPITQYNPSCHLIYSYCRPTCPSCPPVHPYCLVQV